MRPFGGHHKPPREAEAKRTCKRKAEGFRAAESGLGSLQAPAGGLYPRQEGRRRVAPTAIKGTDGQPLRRTVSSLRGEAPLSPNGPTP